MGAKLFEITGTNELSTCPYALDEFLRFGTNFPAAVAADIRRIHFDPVPPPDAGRKTEEFALVYVSTQGESVVQHVFAGDKGYLVGKRFFEKGKEIATVDYYEYLGTGSTAFPRGIILHNRKYGYSLTLRLKDQAGN